MCLILSRSRDTYYSSLIPSTLVSITLLVHAITSLYIVYLYIFLLHPLFVTKMTSIEIYNMTTLQNLFFYHAHNQKTILRHAFSPKNCQLISYEMFFKGHWLSPLSSLLITILNSNNILQKKVKKHSLLPGDSTHGKSRIGGMEPLVSCDGQRYALGQIKLKLLNK